METEKETKYLRFIMRGKIDSDGVVSRVYSRRAGDLLGSIDWYDPWGCYEFNSLENIEFSSGCLREIADYLDELMAMREKK